MNGYLIGLLIGLPVVLAGFLLLNRNRALQKAGVILMAAVLLGSAGLALSMRTAIVSMPAGLADLGLPLSVVANLAVLAGLAYLSRAWKNRWIGGLLVVQAGMLIWLAVSGRGVSQYGFFVLDHLALLMLLLVNGTGALALLFSLKYMERHEQRRGIDGKRSALFIAAAAFMTPAMSGLLLADHLLWLLFFWQSLIVAGFILISHDRTAMALKNGRSFVGWQLFGGAVFLAGAIGVHSLARTLTISELLVFNDANLTLLPVAFLVMACLVMAAQFPFQAGLLHCAAAPTPAAVMLQAVTLVNAGIYLMIRISPLLMNTWLAKVVAVIGMFSFAAAALLALMQHDSKRVFIFSTISCAGLAIALASLANLQAIYAAILLTLLHGATKTLLLLATSGNASSRLSMSLTLLAALSMLLPPFGIPLMQWTALEAVTQNPVAVLLLVAGIVISMLYWARFIVKRLETIGQAGAAKLEPLYAFPQIAAAVALVLLGLFSVPFTNWLIAPVLRENFRRFSDIAQGDAASFLIRDWVGINPLLLFAALVAIVVPGWLVLRWLCLRQAVAPVVESTDEVAAAAAMAEPQETETDAETDVGMDSLPDVATGDSIEPTIVEPAIVAVVEKDAEELAPLVDERPAVVFHFPTRTVLSIFPDAPKTHLYVTVIAGALIILMFEVVIR